MSLHPDMCGAVLSRDQRYRYRLWRRWGSEPTMVFIGLNPSKADASDDDHSIRRMCTLARREGAGGIDVYNLYALRSTDPDALADEVDPVGPDNQRHLKTAARSLGLIIAAWGSHGFASARADQVRSLVTSAGHELHCFGRTASGAPRHPSRLPNSAGLELWT